MAKDALGHGSGSKGGSSEWGHQEHWNEANKQLKAPTHHLQGGRPREAADAMAKAKEHASMAQHLLMKQTRLPVIAAANKARADAYTASRKR